MILTPTSNYIHSQIPIEEFLCRLTLPKLGSKRHPHFSKVPINSQNQEPCQHACVSGQIDLIPLGVLNRFTLWSWVY